VGWWWVGWWWDGVLLRLDDDDVSIVVYVCFEATQQFIVETIRGLVRIDHLGAVLASDQGKLGSEWHSLGECRIFGEVDLYHGIFEIHRTLLYEQWRVLYLRSRINVENYLAGGHDVVLG
jgi:hypothetical protein